MKADPRRVRARWLAADGANLGQVTDHARPPRGAVRVRVCAILTGGIEARGADKSYRILSVAELAGLDPLWARPLLALNARGERIAREAIEPALTETFRTVDRQSPETFKAPPITSAWLEAQARREGRRKTAVILDALELYRVTKGNDL